MHRAAPDVGEGSLPARCRARGARALHGRARGVSRGQGGRPRQCGCAQALGGRGDAAVRSSARCSRAGWRPPDAVRRLRDGGLSSGWCARGRQRRRRRHAKARGRVVVGRRLCGRVGRRDVRPVQVSPHRGGARGRAGAAPGAARRASGAVCIGRARSARRAAARRGPAFLGAGRGLGAAMSGESCPHSARQSSPATRVTVTTECSRPSRPSAPLRTPSRFSSSGAPSPHGRPRAPSRSERACIRSGPGPHSWKLNPSRAAASLNN
mmetsp:Transcript_4968/g.19819  ORF Transcript_4968/g.19819 Transcript_4968/m.19819 type:complete len:266 (+) Transcript_4968:476-1273(+)